MRTKGQSERREFAQQAFHQCARTPLIGEQYKEKMRAQRGEDTLRLTVEPRRKKHTCSTVNSKASFRWYCASILPNSFRIDSARNTNSTVVWKVPKNRLYFSFASAWYHKSGNLDTLWYGLFEDFWYICDASNWFEKIFKAIDLQKHRLINAKFHALSFFCWN